MAVKVIKKRTSDISKNLQDKLFPYSFSLDKKLTIINQGPALKKLLSSYKINKENFNEIFSFKELKKNLSIDYNWLNKNQDREITLEIKKANNTQLTGKILSTGKTGVFTFFCHTALKIKVPPKEINSNLIEKIKNIEVENKYSNLLSNMDLGIMEVDNSEKILYVNKAFERISGYSSKELTGKTASQILLDEHAQEKINIQERKKRRQGKEGLYEIKIKKKNGEHRNWIISGVPVHDNKNKIKGSIGIHWDITETRKTDSKFLFDSIQKEKQLIEARIQAEENQREIIGRDLHDGIGQMLVYLGLYLKLLKEKKTIKHTDIEKAESTIQKTLDETRRLSRNLAPPTIKELGLKDSIVELIGSFSILLKPTFKLNIYKGSDPEKLQYDQKIMMYRIVQELCSNTFKYANAKKVSIDLLGDIHGLNLKYHDDGIGFDTKKMKTGIGLKGILSRVEYYGGKFVIESSPQKGIQVLLNLPFK